jgi:hypothetical protein
VEQGDEADDGDGDTALFPFGRPFARCDDHV